MDLFEMNDKSQLYFEFTKSRIRNCADVVLKRVIHHGLYRIWYHVDIIFLLEHFVRDC